MSSAGRRYLFLLFMFHMRGRCMFVQVMDVYTRYRLGHVLGLPETCQFQVGVLSALLREYHTFLLARHEFLAREFLADQGLPQKQVGVLCPACIPASRFLPSSHPPPDHVAGADKRPKQPEPAHALNQQPKFLTLNPNPEPRTARMVQH